MSPSASNWHSNAGASAYRRRPSPPTLPQYQPSPSLTVRTFSCDRRCPAQQRRQATARMGLQDPADYLRTLTHTVPDVLHRAGVEAHAVVGIGIDITACTMLPVDSAGRGRRDEI